MPRNVDWPTYQALVDQLLAVVKDFIAQHRIDYETMLAVLVLFQASMLTGPAMRVQEVMQDLDAFLAFYANDVTRMVREGVARAPAMGGMGREAPSCSAPLTWPDDAPPAGLEGP